MENLRKIAKLIAQYNGQAGTEKQIDKVLKMYQNNEQMMKNFCNGRIKLN